MIDDGSKPANLSVLVEVARLVAGGKVGEATALIRKNWMAGRFTLQQTHDRDGIWESNTRFFRNFRNHSFVARGLKDFEFPSLDPKHDGNVQFVEQSFANANGKRDYKLFIPAEQSSPRPLVVMLHGCTQSPNDFAAGTRMNDLAQEEGIYVAYPRQTQDANAQKCWNWFEIQDQGRGCGETRIIAGLTKAIIADYPIDPQRVYIAGLSAGGAAAANIARAYPDVFAAVGIHSGLAAGCARDLSSALLAMKAGAPGSDLQGGSTQFGASASIGSSRIPTIVFHGDHDVVINPRNGEEVLAQAGIAGLSSTREIGIQPGGHAYTRDLYHNGDGHVWAESWRIAGAGHAWSGGSEAGSYTDPLGPDASRAMLDFFAHHRLAVSCHALGSTAILSMRRV